MRKKALFLFFGFVFSLLFFSFVYLSEQNNKSDSNKIAVITTKYGDIKIKLYAQTPLHQDNFVKLVSEKFFDDLLFHRVIKGFMIQGGDPDSRNAKAGTMLGNGGPGYNIPAEIVPGLFHKRGALAAARESDMINPKRESSGSQFYIVQGKVFTNQELDMIEANQNQALKKQVIGKILTAPENKKMLLKLDSLQKSGNKEELNKFIMGIDPIVEKEMTKQGKFVFTAEQRKIYTTIGGAPHLDGSYSVFGEVIEGMNVIDSISSVKTDKNDRPLVDVKMKIKL